MEFITDTKDLSELKCEGFFVGWPNPPDEKTLKEIILNSQHFVLAVENGRVIGFINAISDKILSAYIPLLEVLPEFQGKGLGTELVKRMKEELSRYYMIDLSCDDSVAPFYLELGFSKNNSMFIRNYDKQSGK